MISSKPMYKDNISICWSLQNSFQSAGNGGMVSVKYAALTGVLLHLSPGYLNTARVVDQEINKKSRRKQK